MRRILNGNFPITQIFGVNKDAYAQFGLKGHNGIDFGCPTGTDCISPIDGVCVEKGDDPHGYGLYIRIESADRGVIFGHLSVQGITQGATVVEGMTIGKSGSTGNSTGPHLHFGLYPIPRDRTNGFAGYIDPMPFLNSDTPTTPDPLSICNQRLGELQADADRKQGVIEDRDNEIIRLKGEKLTLQEENQTLSDALDASKTELQTTINDKTTTILALEAEIKTLQNEVKDQQDSIVELQASKEALQTKVETFWDSFTYRDCFAKGFEKLFNFLKGR